MAKRKNITIEFNKENVARLIAISEKIRAVEDSFEIVFPLADVIINRYYRFDEIIETLIERHIDEERFYPDAREEDSFYSRVYYDHEETTNLVREYKDVEQYIPDRVFALTEKLMSPLNESNEVKNNKKKISKDSTKKEQFYDIFLLNWLGYETYRFYCNLIKLIPVDEENSSILDHFYACTSEIFFFALHPDAKEKKSSEYFALCDLYSEQINNMISELHCPFEFKTFIEKNYDVNIPYLYTFNFDKIERNDENGKKYAWLFEDAITICNKLFNWTESYDTYYRWCEQFIDEGRLYKIIYDLSQNNYGLDFNAINKKAKKELLKKRKERISPN